MVAMKNEAVYVRRILRGPSPVELQYVVFNDTKVDLKVIPQVSQRDALTITRIAKKSGAIAVINGGYFNAGGDFGPCGLEIGDGKRSGSLETPSPLGGALIVRDGKADLVWDPDFKDGDDITQYVHCSPWFVSDGKPLPDPQKSQQVSRAWRTFIATDRKGGWLIGISSPISLSELSELLIDPEITSGLKVDRALNLDGGPSSGLWWGDAKGAEHSNDPGWPVRNFIAAVPRASP
jgi:exopolysaccharide biosynthesis protein